MGSTPGEHGFKQAARSIDSAFNAAHSAAALPLKSALQGVLFVLDELTGLIHSGPMYNGLGLKVWSAACASFKERERELMMEICLKQFQVKHDVYTSVRQQ